MRLFNRKAGVLSLMALPVMPLLSACGGGQVGDTPASPAVHNDSSGQVVGSAVVGVDGGLVSSTDGVITLEIPAGALANDTQITIRSMAEGMTGSALPAYEFEPDGLTFNIPAHLRLTATAPAFNAANVGLAYADAQGHWRLSSVEAVAHTDDRVEFALPHFSRWSFYEQWFISPQNTEVGVNEAVDLGVWFIACDDGSSDEDCLLTPLVPNASVNEWRVNGVLNGSASDGTLENVAASAAGRRYNAPAQVPAANPVSVSATIDRTAQGQGLVLLNSDIRVVADAGWSGAIAFEFASNSNHTHQNGTRTVALTYQATQNFVDVLSEALMDDGSGLVILELGAPRIELRYQSTTIDTFTGEDVEGCVATQTQTTVLTAPQTPDVSLAFNTTAQFNLDGHSKASPAVFVPPPAAISGAFESKMEGCGLDADSQNQINASWFNLELTQSVDLSGESEDGRLFRGASQVPAAVTVDGEELNGLLEIRWTLQRHQ